MPEGPSTEVLLLTLFAPIAAAIYFWCLLPPLVVVTSRWVCLLVADEANRTSIRSLSFGRWFQLAVLKEMLTSLLTLGGIWFLAVFVSVDRPGPLALPAAVGFAWFLATLVSGGVYAAFLSQALDLREGIASSGAFAASVVELMGIVGFLVTGYLVILSLG